MPQAKAGIATTILAPEPVGEGFVEISPNKTLFIQKLTNEDPVRPEIIQNLETVEKVFDHFKPNCDVELDREDGSTVKTNFRFSGLGDFDIKSLTNQSEYLKNLSLENDACLKIIKQLRTNKSLQKVIENPETRLAFVNALKTLASELEEEQG
jgi:predicted component of type VI protein secretion system